MQWVRGRTPPLAKALDQWWSPLKKVEERLHSGDTIRSGDKGRLEWPAIGRSR